MSAYDLSVVCRFMIRDTHAWVTYWREDGVLLFSHFSLVRVLFYSDKVNERAHSTECAWRLVLIVDKGRNTMSLLSYLLPWFLEADIK